MPGSWTRVVGSCKQDYARPGVGRFSMLYYIFLFGVCLVGGLVVFWLYKEATTIGKKDHKTLARGSKLDPTDHLKGVAMHTTINYTPISWGGDGSLAPRHPARSQAAKPSRSTYWDLPGDRKLSAKPNPLGASPDGSKSESEFWNYFVTPDRPGHGTGIKPGHGAGIKRHGASIKRHGASIRPGHGTGIKQ